MSEKKPENEGRKSLWRRKWPRRMAAGAGGLVLVVLILVALAPAMLSGSFGRGLVEDAINKRISGRVTIGQMSLAWGAGQKLGGVKLAGADGKTILDSASVDAPELSIWSAMWGGRHFGDLKVHVQQGDLIQDAAGELNLTKAIAPPAGAAGSGATGGGTTAKTASQPLGGVTAKLALALDHVRFSAPSSDPIDVSGATCDIDLSNPAKSVGFKLGARVEQSKLAGNVAADGTASDLFDAQGDFSAKSMRIDGSTTIKDMPTALVDRLTGQLGKYAALLGPSINASAKVSGKLEQITADITAKSENLTCDLKISSDGKQLKATPDSSIVLTVKPAAWATWVGGDMKLRSPFDVSLKLARLTIGQKPAGDLDLPTTSLDTSFKVGDILLDGLTPTDQVKVSDAVATVASTRMADGTKVTVHATVQKASDSGKVAFVATAHNLFDPAGKFSLARTSADVKAKVTDLPMPALDELFKTGGWLAQAVGPKLTVKMSSDLSQTADGQSFEGPWTLAVISDHINGQVAGLMKDGKFSLTDKGEFKIEIQPAMLAKAQDTGGSAVRLAQAVMATLTINKLEAPAPGGNPEWEKLNLNINGSLAAATLHGAPAVGDVTLSDTGFSVISQSLGQSVTIDGHSVGQLQGSSGEAHLLATVSAPVTKGAPETWWGPHKQVQLKVTTSKFPVLIIDQVALMNGLLASTLGPTVDATITATMDSADSGKADVVVKSANADVAISAAIAQNKLTVAPNGHATLALSPEAVTTLLAPYAKDQGWADGLGVAGKANVEAKLAGLSAATSPFDWKAVSLDGVTITVSDLTLVGKNVDGMTVSNLVATVVSKRLGDTVNAKLTGKLKTRQGTSDIDASARLTGLGAKNQGGDATLTASAFPLALVDQFAGTEGKTVVLLGPIADQITVKMTPGAAGPDGVAPMALSGLIKSDRLTVNAEGEFRPGVSVALTKPATIQLRIERDAYNALFPSTPAAKAVAAKPVQQAEPGFLDKIFNSGGKAADTPAALPPTAPMELAGAFTLKGTISSASAKFKPVTKEAPGGIDKDSIALACDLHTEGLAFRRTDGSATAKMDSLTVHVDAVNPSRQITLCLNGQTVWQAGGAQDLKGSIDSNIVLQDVIQAADGTVAWDKVRVDTTTTAQNVATVLIDQLLDQQGKLAVLLGPTASMTVKGKYPGDLDVMAKATNLDLSAKMAAGDDRVLRLREDSVTLFQITPETVQVLGLLNPQLLMLKSTKAPATLTIKKAGFVAPMPSAGGSFDVTKLTATMDLLVPEATIARKGWLQGIWGLMQKIGATKQQGETMVVTFTPLHVDLSKGIVTTNDMWMVSQDMVLGTQGKVNLGVTPATADMTVGISAQMLKNIPGANKLSWNYLIEDRMSGPINDLDIDIGILAASIGKLGLGAIPGIGEVAPHAIDLLTGVLGNIVKNPAPKLSWPNQPKVTADQPAAQPDTPAPQIQPKPQPKPEPKPQPKPPPKDDPKPKPKPKK